MDIALIGRLKITLVPILLAAAAFLASLNCPKADDKPVMLADESMSAFDHSLARGRGDGGYPNFSQSVKGMTAFKESLKGGDSDDGYRNFGEWVSCQRSRSDKHCAAAPEPGDSPTPHAPTTVEVNPGMPPGVSQDSGPGKAPSFSLGLAYPIASSGPMRGHSGCPGRTPTGGIPTGGTHGQGTPHPGQGSGTVIVSNGGPGSASSAGSHGGIGGSAGGGTTSMPNANLGI